MTAIAILKRDEIISKVSTGAMLKSVAADVGVTPAAISNQLKDDPDYLQAREQGALARLEDQYEAIQTAPDVLGVSRAREGFKAAAWFAEREFPKRWGAKQDNLVTIQIDSDVGLAGAAGDLLLRARARRSTVEDAQIVDAEQQTTLPSEDQS